MIITGVLTLVFAPLIVILDTLPTVTLPDWFDGTSTACGNGLDADVPLQLGCLAYQVGRRVAWFDGWLPTGLLFTVFGFVGAVWLTALAIRGARSLISLATGGGGV